MSVTVKLDHHGLVKEYHDGDGVSFAYQLLDHGVLRIKRFEDVDGQRATTDATLFSPHGWLSVEGDEFEHPPRTTSL